MSAPKFETDLGFRPPRRAYEPLSTGRMLLIGIVGVPWFACCVWMGLDFRVAFYLLVGFGALLFFTQRPPRNEHLLPWYRRLLRRD